MAFQFKKASRAGIYARIALIGPSGSGKSWKGLAIGSILAGDKRLAVVDTERGSINRYAGDFDFDTLRLESFNPDTYIEALDAAASAGYGAVLIDSLSHAWIGKDGALDTVDKIVKKSGSGNSFTAWRDVTPMHNRLVDALLATNMHLITTLRSKTEYILEENDRGKKVPRKVGMAPIQRDGMEYEFDIVGDLNLDNDLVVSKTRATFLRGAVVPMKGTEQLGRDILAWCTEGGEPEPVGQPVPRESLDRLVIFCEKNNIKRDDVKDKSLELFSKQVSELNTIQFSQLMTAINPQQKEMN